jgi:hypothetical protein
LAGGARLGPVKLFILAQSYKLAVNANIAFVTVCPVAQVSRNYLYGPAVCCKPDVSDGGIGLALLYPARE